MKQYGVWLDFPDNKPEDGEKVIVRRKGYGLNWDMAVYNEYHECWDDCEEDDYWCELNEVDKFMRIPKIE